MKKRRFLIGVLIFLGLLLVLVGGAWLYVTSDAGAERIRGIALSKVADTLEGKLDAKKLTLRGGLIVIEDAKLYTPEGELVAELVRLEADVDLAALTRGNVVIRHADIDGLRLYLATSDQGLNLVRAVKLKHPSLPKVTDGRPAEYQVDVRNLRLKNGFFSWEKDAYQVDDLTIEGGTRVFGPGLNLDGAATLKGKLLGAEEGQGPLTLDVAASGTQAKLKVDVKLGDAHLDTDLNLDALALDIRELVVPPAVAQRFVPADPLKVPLKVRGTASLQAADLKLEAGTARAALKAELGAPGVVEAFELTADDVDLVELFGQGKRSKIHLVAKGALKDPKLETLDADLNLKLTWPGIGQADVVASAKQGKLSVERAQVDVPGASATVRGTGNTSAVRVRGNVAAEDLGKLMTVIAEQTGTEPIPLAGRGAVDLQIDGPLRHPHIQLDGDFEALHVANVTMNAVTAEVELADALRPFEATVHLAARRVLIGERVLDDVHARLDTRGRDLDLELSTKGLTDVKLTAHGTVDPDGLGVAIATLALQYPEETWTLEAPTHLSIAKGLDVETLVLRAAEQRVEARVSLKQGVLDALVDATALELTRLPRAFVPTKWGLGGKLDLHATAVGKSDKPDLEATLKWRDGSLRTLRQVDVDAKVGLKAMDRLTATASGSSTLGKGSAEATLSVKQLLAGKGAEPLTASVAIENVNLEGIGPLAAVDLPAKGIASLKLEATGTASKPRVTAHAEAVDGVWVVKQRGEDRFIPVEKLVLDVVPDAADDTLAATVKARAFGGDITVALKTPLTLVGLRAKAPELEALKVMPLDVRAQVQHVSLSALEGANLVASDGTVKGALSLDATATGTLLHPDVAGTLSLEQAAHGRVKPFDADVEFKTTRTNANVKLLVKNAKAQLAKVSAQAEAPLETLTDVDALTGIGFRANGDIGPFTLDDVLAPALEEEQPRGTVQASVEALGTVVDPQVHVRGQLEQVALGKVALGKANLQLDYDDAKSKLAVTLFTTNGGTLRAAGTVSLDLSQPAVMKGLEWRQAPVALQVDSQQLDLGFLSGTLEQLPKVEGRLDAKATLSGTLGLPTFVGELALTKGRVAIAGFGEYREVEVKLNGSDEAVTLEKLYAKSSGGFVNVTGAAHKRGDAWALNVSGTSQNFPIIVDDQLKASATLEVQAEGLASAELIDIPKLRIPRAVIELPEVKSRDLQSLERPDSIILVRAGVPVSNKQRKKLERLRDPKVAARKPLVIRAVVDAPQNVWVKGSDLQIELGLSEGFRVEIAESPALFGEVHVKRGRIDVIGRRFDVDNSSTVRVSGPATRAYVNIIATHKNEREGVTVYATVTGQMPQFSIRLTSNPPLSESDIFTLVATGRRTLKSGGSSSAITAEQALSVVGAFAFSQFKGALQKQVPLDVLSVEAGSNGLIGTRVETGKYLTDQLYLGYQFQYGADPKKGENTNAGKVEYQFLPHWAVETYGGDAGAFGADLVWSREY